MSRSISFKRVLIVSAAVAAALCIGAILVMPWIKTLYNPELRESFTAFVASLGFMGSILTSAIQVLKVIIAIIPGEPIELMAGVLYGGFGGLALCLAGCIAGSTLIFSLMRKLGQPILDRIFKKKKLQEYSFMQDSRKLETVTLFLFLLPGTPKDMLTYIAGTTPMPLVRFIMISTLARIPSIVTSTFIGNSVLEGHWYTALILTLVTLALGLVGIFFRERAIAFCHSISARRSKAVK